MVDPGMDALKLAPNYRPMTSTQMAANGAQSTPGRLGSSTKSTVRCQALG
jgi:hypothetical protein